MFLGFHSVARLGFNANKEFEEHVLLPEQKGQLLPRDLTHMAICHSCPFEHFHQTLMFECGVKLSGSSLFFS